MENTTFAFKDWKIYQGLNYFPCILGIQNTYTAENMYVHHLKKGTLGELSGIDIVCCSLQLFIILVQLFFIILVPFSNGQDKNRQVF